MDQRKPSLSIPNDKRYLLIAVIALLSFILFILLCVKRKKREKISLKTKEKVRMGGAVRQAKHDVATQQRAQRTSNQPKDSNPLDQSDAPYQSFIAAHGDCYRKLLGEHGYAELMAAYEIMNATQPFLTQDQKITVAQQICNLNLQKLATEMVGVRYPDVVEQLPYYFNLRNATAESAERAMRDPELQRMVSGFTQQLQTLQCQQAQHMQQSPLTSIPQAHVPLYFNQVQQQPSFFMQQPIQKPVQQVIQRPVYQPMRHPIAQRMHPPVQHPMQQHTLPPKSSLMRPAFILSAQPFAQQESVEQSTNQPYESVKSVKSDAQVLQPTRSNKIAPQKELPPLPTDSMQGGVKPYSALSRDVIIPAQEPTTSSHPTTLNNPSSLCFPASVRRPSRNKIAPQKELPPLPTGSTQGGIKSRDVNIPVQEPTSGHPTTSNNPFSLCFPASVRQPSRNKITPQNELPPLPTGAIQGGIKSFGHPVIPRRPD